MVRKKKGLIKNISELAFFAAHQKSLVFIYDMIRLARNLGDDDTILYSCYFSPLSS